MPSLKDIRKRIGSVKNTQKITSAMKLVSASYFAKAVQLAAQNRPYSQAFNQMVNRIIGSRGDEIGSPFIGEYREEKVLLIIVGTDRGLCGALNANNFKNAIHWIKEKKAKKISVSVVTWGKKAQLFGRKLEAPIVGAAEKVLEKPTYDKAGRLGQDFINKFLIGKYDHVFIAFSEFKSAMEQIPVVMQLMPIVPDRSPQKSTSSVSPNSSGDLLVEPSLKTMVDRLLERKVIADIFRVLVSSSASEHGARMTAMDSATNNAGEVIKQLTIKYNRARQAAITKELIEIISGAESLH